MATLDQLSTPISRETREQLDRYSKRTGVKKGHLVEEALRSYLSALEMLPSDVVVPNTIVLDARSSRRFVRELRGRKANPAAPGRSCSCPGQIRTASRLKRLDQCCVETRRVLDLG